MAPRWREPAAFRADPIAAAPAHPVSTAAAHPIAAAAAHPIAAAATHPIAAGAARPTRRQALALLVALVLVAGAAVVASLVVRPDDARTFDLFGGSVLLEDSIAPVAVDLASGQPTVRLVDAATQVGAQRAGDVGVVPMGGSVGGALLLDRRTGEFNIVDSTGFVLKKNGGVPLPQRTGTTDARALAAADFAYVLRSGATGTSAYLVGTDTVARATAGGPVRPRGFRSLPEPLDPAAGNAVTTGNDLWLLAGTGATRSVRRLSLPSDSRTGVTLRSQTLGSVTGPAALASAGDVTAVADTGRVRVWRGDHLLRTVTFPTIAGADAVLAASNSTDRLSFLVHGRSGWQTVSVGRDGSDRNGPNALTGIGADATLAAPAASAGSLYTVDTGSGALWRIAGGGAADPILNASSYPVVERSGRAIEAGSFADATVYARGPRVVINSPDHLMAVAVFTDGSSKPVPFTKSDAKTINSGGGAEALTRSRDSGVRDRTPAPGRSTPTPAPAPITNLVDCTRTSQTPHIPVLGTPVPGSRSAQLSWTYPITDRTDCVPRTYVVSVRLLSGNAPAPPASVTVDGQLGVNLLGLYPSSRYQVTVTAYLNGIGTPSTPIELTTGPQGPNAPAGVTVSAGAGGDWTLSWRSCGAAGSSCVPAASWRIVPQLCDAGGLAGAPAATEVPADPTTTVQPGARIAGGALLGRALSFRVEGVGAGGAVGTPSAATACTNSWTPPDASALRLSASKPDDADAGGTTSTTLSLDLGGNAVRTAGGTGASVSFTLSGPGGTQTRTATVDGRSSVLTQTFPGVRPGGVYRASASVSPPGHPEAAVSVDADSVTTRAQWPGLGLDASCAKTGDLTCALSVRITGIGADTTGGERLVLADGSTLRCGEVSLPLPAGGLDQSNWTITAPDVSQLDKFFGSDCRVTVSLVESGSDSGPLYFGNVPSPVVSTSVDLGPPAAAGLQSGDFAAAWSTDGARVDYTGGISASLLALLTTNWTATLYAPDGTACGTAGSLPNPVVVPANSCVQTYGTITTGWRVRLGYTDATDGETHTVDVALADGAPPGYRACSPGDFDATWGATRDAGVRVSSPGGELGGCVGFGYRLVSADDTACGTGDGAPPVGIAITCGDAAGTGWRVDISWTNPDGSNGQATAPVTGDAPPN